MFGVYAVHIGERQNNDYCQRSQQDEEQRRRRNILLRAGRKRPMKKSKLAAPGPSIYQAWPAFRPFDLFRGIVQAGLRVSCRLAWLYPYIELSVLNSKYNLNLRLQNQKNSFSMLRNDDSIDLVEFWNEARSEDWGARLGCTFDICLCLCYFELVLLPVNGFLIVSV